MTNSTINDLMTSIMTVTIRGKRPSEYPVRISLCHSSLVPIKLFHFIVDLFMLHSLNRVRTLGTRRFIGEAALGGVVTMSPGNTGIADQTVLRSK